VFFVKIGETITFTREISASTGYGVYPVVLENLALLDIATDPSVVPLFGTPAQRHFTFLAIREGVGKVQFAKFRPWEPSAAVYEDSIPINVESADGEFASNSKTGAFSPFSKLDGYTRDVFKQAFSRLIGAEYEPLLVASQAVGGTNYIFAANARAMHAGSISYPVLVRIHQPHSGGTEIVKIISLGHPHHIGAYMAFTPVKPEQQTILDAALKGLSGSRLTADYVSTQLVSGTNYRFAGTQTLDTKDADKYPVLFTVYQPLSGAPVLTGVQKAFELQ
jgi:hypothetical protein